MNRKSGFWVGELWSAQWEIFRTTAGIFASIDRWKICPLRLQPGWARADAWQQLGPVVSGRICCVQQRCSIFTLAVGTAVSLPVQADVQLVGLKIAKLACK